MNEQGKQAEKLALSWLKNNKLSLIESNYSCRFGEIDLIMLDDLHLVFIEVRLRTNSRFGSAANSVNVKKQQKIITTARHFLMTNQKFCQHICRFDVIAFESSSAQSCPVWYKDAFRL
ncbi:MAG: YraN family protein [Oceanospirillaceae bacterium]